MRSVRPAPIGDVVRALGFPGVAADPVRRAVALATLGWSVPEPKTVASTSPDEERRRERIGFPPYDRMPPPPNSSTQPPVRPLRLRHLTAPVPKTTQETAPEAVTVRADVGPLPLPSPEEHRPLFDAPIAPLFEPKLGRAILGRLSAVRMRRGEVDVPAVVAAIAAGRPMTTVPRRPVSTLASGLQMLVDTSPHMAPFLEDAARLVDQLGRIVGVDALSIRYFDHCPSSGVSGEDGFTMVAYDPPRLGTPVLVVSDLGVMRGTALERRLHTVQWKGFLRRMTAAQVPLTVLSPYPASRYGNSGLTRHLRLITWDRGTGVRDVPLAALVGGA